MLHRNHIGSVISGWGHGTRQPVGTAGYSFFRSARRARLGVPKSAHRQVRSIAASEQSPSPQTEGLQRTRAFHSRGAHATSPALPCPIPSTACCSLHTDASQFRHPSPRFRPNDTTCYLARPCHTLAGQWAMGPSRSCARAHTFHFAESGKAGSFPTSRASCWMITVAFVFAAIVFTRLIEAMVCARSVLKIGTPSF